MKSRTPYGPYRSLQVPIFRASTVVFERASDVTDHWDQRQKGFSYGLYGTPTVLELAARIASLEGASDTFITPGGQSALTLIYFTFLHAGAHVLIPESIYGPSGRFAEEVLKRFGVVVEFYPSMIGGEIAALIRDSTRLIWCESPGSVTLEVQDLPAIVDAARKWPDVTVALDNTWAAGVLVDAFALGVDVTMQALTKYVGGTRICCSALSAFEMKNGGIGSARRCPKSERRIESRLAEPSSKGRPHLHVGRAWRFLLRLR